MPVSVNANVSESEKDRSRGDAASTRLAQLRERVERATHLIADLREANYALKGELASLKRKVDSLEGERAHDRGRGREVPDVSGGDASLHSAPSSSAGLDPGVHEELQTLRDERKIIRAKVQNLLERIEKLDL
jgi:predicted RNase H-like nuclease (RuvC/YqgF family)